MSSSNANPDADTDTTTITFGTRLKAILDDRTLSQAQLARDSKLDRAEVNRLCNDKRDPRPHEVVRIARALEMTAEDLLHGVSLPSEFAEVRAEVERISAELLEFEQEKEAAVTELKTLESQIENERKEWQQEREAMDSRLAAQEDENTQQIEQLQRQAAQQAQALHNQLAAERERCAGEVAAIKRAASARERHLLAELRAAQDAHRAARQELVQAGARIGRLQRSVRALQAEVNNLRGQRVLTGVLGALGGIMLGASGRDDDG